jgi:hypothetical protein
MAVVRADSCTSTSGLERLERDQIIFGNISSGGNERSGGRNGAGAYPPPSCVSFGSLTKATTQVRGTHTPDVVSFEGRGSSESGSVANANIDSTEMK